MESVVRDQQELNLGTALQLGLLPFTYESREGLTSGLLLPDSLVFTHETKEDEILGGDPKTDPGSDYSLYCVPLLSNQTKGIKTSTIG